MNRFLSNKFSLDLLWNYASLAVLASSGIIINLVIAHSYGASALGLFNLIYAIYIFVSQFCIGGLHYSVLRSLASELHFDEVEKRLNIGTALFLSFIVSSFFSIILYLLKSNIGTYLGGEQITQGIVYLSFSLVFFSLNKVLLAVFNGLRHMRLYAFGQAVRYLLMMAFIVLVCIMHLEPSFLALNFLFAESILFFLLFTMVLRNIVNYKLWISNKWFLKHIKFGVRAFLVGVFIEINSRVDVLILGLFVSHRQVGIYSFGAMIAEGLAMFLVVIRNNANPLFANYLSNNKMQDLFSLIRQLRKYTYLGILFLTLVLIGIFPIVVNIILNKPEFLPSWYILIILASGIWLTSGYLPCTDILTQANKPTCQTVQNALVVLSNALFNFILIPILGIYGSALATVLASYILSIYYLSVLVKRNLGFSLFSLKTSA